ncbi:MAG: peptidylprolyl isomerase [Clostridia bacterium]|nr:peptidylprolyl isomerase [Clostridia bacterium]
MINKDKLKGFAIGAVCAAMLCTGSAFAESMQKTFTAYFDNIKVMVNGEEKNLKDTNGNAVEPFIVDGTTYLPVRAISELFNTPISWDGNSKTIYIGEVPESFVGILDQKTMESLADETVATVGDTQINGSIVSFFINENCSSDMLAYYSDNYTEGSNLQTLTIGGVPASKYLAENMIKSIQPSIAVYNAAKEEGLDKKEENIKRTEEAWQSFKDSFKLDISFENYKKDNGISEEDLRTVIDINTLYQIYTEKLYNQYADKNHSDNELFAMYNSQYVHVKHILVEDEETANEVISKLNKGSDFDTLIAQYNQDYGQGEDGYTFTKGEMVEEFEEASFNLKEKSYTKTPVKTAYGYHIIYRYSIDKTEALKNKDTLIDTLAKNMVNDELKAIISKYPVNYTDGFTTYINNIK